MQSCDRCPATERKQKKTRKLILVSQCCAKASLTLIVAASTKYTKGTYNPAIPNTLLIPISMKTGSFSKLTSSIVAIADLNDSGKTKHGHKSYSNGGNKSKNFELNFTIHTDEPIQ